MTADRAAAFDQRLAADDLAALRREPGYTEPRTPCRSCGGRAANCPHCHGIGRISDTGSALVYCEMEVLAARKQVCLLIGKLAQAQAVNMALERAYRAGDGCGARDPRGGLVTFRDRAAAAAPTTDKPRRCALCTRVIPEDRRSDAEYCSPACQKRSRKKRVRK